MKVREGCWGKHESVICLQYVSYTQKRAYITAIACVHASIGAGSVLEADWVPSTHPSHAVLANNRKKSETHVVS